MDRKKIFCCLALAIFLSVILLPLQEAEAFRGTLNRDRFIMNPPGGNQDQPSPDPEPWEPTPQDPVEEPDPGPAPDPGEGSGDGGYSGYIPGSSNFRSERSRGAYIPPAPSNPTYPSPSPKPEPDPGPSPDPDPPQQPEKPSGLTPAEAQAFALLNETRAMHNLPPLEIHYGLVETARLKAQDIAENDYFSHVSPTYGSLGQMLRKAGISYSRAAENLSKAGNVSQAHVQLLYSTKGHREIMLSPDYSKVGIGISSLKNVPGIIMVQHYID
jgi:uncharacterized protein YkwD